MIDGCLKTITSTSEIIMNHLTDEIIMQFYQCPKSVKIIVLYMTNSTNLGVNILSIINIVINVFSLQSLL